MACIMLLGSGELGKEFVISAKRMGHYVIACDSYNDAPAMQVADRREVFDMLDADSLRSMIDLYQPDMIVPEIEAIATHILYEAEDNGIQVVPSARAVNLTMNRDAIRDRAAELGIRTAKFAYAENEAEYFSAVKQIGLPFVVKPVMSSSGKGQSIVRDPMDVEKAWTYAIKNMRGKREKVIVEEFIDFDFEITLLTIVEKNGNTIFCPPIGHVQKNGDYQQSWQPQPLPSVLAHRAAEAMANIITADLGGAGLFGVEFFVKGDEVIFSELSPRPHDTGMVTLISQNLSEFDLHLRAITGLPIPGVRMIGNGGASSVILADKEIDTPTYSGIEEAVAIPGEDVRIIGKPVARKNRRMGVVLAPDVNTAIQAAGKISVN